ncbi:ABC transporter substrate-binding protein [Loigolactobacillus binensis]|uniref:ABC transporter substrate-binding protein n=1 Tax=Loigolactobacillus binensis TaxID=2559922 RepID=A0ABW3E9S3_9LACO|nr:ABC transporter substrate-binding protein [Loigolactobacillus binensis]
MALPNAIQRIGVVGILPLPAVLAMFFDVADKIVTISHPSMLAAQHGPLAQLYPEILKADDSFNPGLDVDTTALKKLAPDVVFYRAEATAMQQKLRAAGFTAVGISTESWNHDPIETLRQWIMLLEKIFPKNAKAQIVADYNIAMRDRVQQRVSQISPEQRKTVFFLSQYSATRCATSGRTHWGQYWAETVGAKNVVNDPGGAIQVTMAQINQWNPEIIFITNFTPAQPTDLYNNTIGDYDWSKVAAVKNKQAYKMPLGMYRSYAPGGDTPLTLLWMAKTVYPTQFADINIIEETKTYYKKVFNVTLTDQQAAKIFKPSSAASAY